MQVCTDLICQLLDRLYAAPTSSIAWEAFLAQLNQFCGSEQVYLRLPADAAPQPASQQPSADQHLLQTVFTNGPVSPGRYLAAGPRAHLLAQATGLALGRSQARGAFSEEAIQLLAALRPHLARVSGDRISGGRHEAAVERQSPVSPLGWFPALFDIPVIALDRCCAVAEVSPAARVVLEKGGLRVVGANLATDDEEEDDVLRGLLSQAGPLTQTQLAADPNPQFGGTALFSRPGSQAPLRVVLMRLGAPVTPDGPTALLFLQSPAQRPFPRSAQLRSLYCLNPTELRLVDQLASGRKVKEAASAMRMTENTTRFHLKEVFRKMEVNSQTELLRTVLSIPGYAETSRSIAV